ncbi:MAG: protoporphyrinogen oxidase [Gemmatimonadaceae bacterium]|nr:protoporphyrinogen oxidase [Gemmatimonadaceae bacterium]
MTPHVLVVGAGLTGLATARHLRAAGHEVTVVDALPEAGGVMQSVVRDGWLVERGPNSCMLTPEMAAMIDAVGLTPALVRANPAGQVRYIVRDGRPVPVPSSPPAFLTSPLFAFAGKLRLLREPFIGRRQGAGDESIADFVRRRLGTEVLDWAIDPFVSGVYAGDPETLSVGHAFPRLVALEREHGSLIRGAIALARRRGAARATQAASGQRGAMISFRDGMQSLPRAMAASLGPRVQCDTRLVALAPRGGDGVRAVLERRGTRADVDADAVVLTVPAHALRTIELPSAAGAAVRRLETLRYPAVSSLALGFTREQVAHPLDGFGCLVPGRERRDVLGILFSSALFPGRAPAGHVLLTCFIGGMRRPDLGMAPTSLLLDRVLPELTALLGVQGDPVFVEHTTWPHAIPQYELGHDHMIEAATAIEGAVPGLVVDGQFRRGVSVGDCVAAGATLAGRVGEMLAGRAGTGGGAVPLTSGRRSAV